MLCTLGRACGRSNQREVVLVQVVTKDVFEASSLPARDVVLTARQCLEQNDPNGALKVLAGQQDADAEIEGLRGAAHFRLENYEEAALHFAKVLAKGGSTPDLEVWRSRAESNARSEIKRHVPAPVDIEAATEPQPGVREPWPAPPRAWPTRAQAWAYGLGRTAGLKAGIALGVLTRKLGGERENSLWTTWYKHGFVRSMIMLAARRA